MKKNQSVKLKRKKNQRIHMNDTVQVEVLQYDKDGYQEPSLVRGKEVYKTPPRVIKQKV
jgi:hypothetical protein